MKKITNIAGLTLIEILIAIVITSNDGSNGYILQSS